MELIYGFLILIFLSLQAVVAYVVVHNQSLAADCLKFAWMMELFSSMYLMIVVGEVFHAMYGDLGDVRPMWERWLQATGLGRVQRALSSVEEGFMSAREFWMDGFVVVIYWNEEWAWF